MEFITGDYLQLLQYSCFTALWILSGTGDWRMITQLTCHSV